MKNTFRPAIKNVGKTLLTIIAVPIMLTVIAVWSAVTFGKVAVEALIGTSKRRVSSKYSSAK